MRVFGIDPGSERTGYGCVDSDGRRHRLVLCGAIRAGAAAAFPDRLGTIYRELSPSSTPAGPTASPSRTSFTPPTCAAR